MSQYFKNIKEGIINSYSQVFFSDYRWFGILLIVSSFVNLNAGISGLVCVVFSLMLSSLLGFNPAFTKAGSYSFNVLLTGLTLGAFCQISLPFLLLLFVATVITLLMSVWLFSYFSRYSLPMLSLPYIFSIWIILFGIKSFTNLDLNTPAGCCSGDLFGLFSISFVSLRKLLDSFALTPLFVSYFKSMGAIFFQHNIFSGILITVGLLIYSRIAFTLSFIGFLSGYVFYFIFQHNSIESGYNAIAINYILTAIAIGGFFLIPSAATYLLVIFSTPIQAFIITAFAKIIEPYHLPLYSLPFSFFVLIVLITLNNRYIIKYFYVVKYQLFSPEKNLYGFDFHLERFKKHTLVNIHLPFYGEWHVSQAHDGKITHKNDFRFAWDFVVTDEHKRTFRLPGDDLTDFYCYGLPVLAPAHGTVVALVDGVEDNTIGDVNLNENWGNTIVIKHSEYLFSKISHIKKDSFKVQIGDYVNKGDVIAMCGSSGRSPEPHIHFQLQETKEIGSKTLKYPLSYYVTKEKEGYLLHSFELPNEKETIFRPSVSPLIKQAFHFIPGMELKFEVKNGNNKSTESWLVCTDSYNNSYLYCNKTKAIAYFTNNDTLFYFTSYVGTKDSLLYYFYLGANKILLSYFPELKLEENLPVETYGNNALKIIQDFVAPFYIFLKANYKAIYKHADETQAPNEIIINSEVNTQLMGGRKKEILFEIELANNKIIKFTIKEKDKCIEAVNIG